MFNPAPCATERRHLSAFFTYRRDEQEIVGDDAIAAAAVDTCPPGIAARVVGLLRQLSSL
jgi:hypothetical protein